VYLVVDLAGVTCCDYRLFDVLTRTHQFLAEHQGWMRLVGIGQMDQRAQVHIDGFVSREELFEMMRLGAVGELTGWAFDARGGIIDGGTNKRLTSIPPQVPAEALTIGAAVGPAKVPAIAGALKGRLINGLITAPSVNRVRTRRHRQR